jgi:hypothetical protein
VGLLISYIASACFLIYYHWVHEPVCQSFCSVQYEANHLHKAWDMLNVVEVVYLEMYLQKP